MPQEGLAEAERLEVQSIADYNIAISKLESAKGTLLRYNNVVMRRKDQVIVGIAKNQKHPKPPPPPGGAFLFYKMQFTAEDAKGHRGETFLGY